MGMASWQRCVRRTVELSCSAFYSGGVETGRETLAERGSLCSESGHVRRSKEKDGSGVKMI